MGYTRQVIVEAASAALNEHVFKSITEDKSVMCKAGTGEVGAAGRIPAGTPMGKITSGSLWQPCAKQIVNSAQGTVNEIDMQAVDWFAVGDTVNIYDVSAGQDLVSGRTITAIDPDSTPPSITISGAAVSVAVGDYLYNANGSAAARGVLMDDVQTLDTHPDVNGDPTYSVRGGKVCTIGTVIEDAIEEVFNLNALIRADLRTGNNCNIVFD